MDMAGLFAPEYISAEEYLKRRYELPEQMPELPLTDEPFVSLWVKKEGQVVLDFLSEEFELPASGFQWENIAALKITFAESLGGRLPVIATESHSDFRAMEALLNGRKKPQEYPPTVNAFTMQTRAKQIYHHRVLLLNYAPYSNIPAETMGIDEADWLMRSHKLRIRHECAHYETLRIFSDMQNHALDEIMADAMGQIAAFGNFDADRQRVFFGLTKGKDICTGRLSFYCQDVAEEERPKVYRAVDRVLDEVAEELNKLQARNAGDMGLLSALAGKSIAERLESIGK